MDKWTTQPAILIRATELQRQTEMGVLPNEAFTAVIEDSTLQVKQIIQSRYDLTPYLGVIPPNLPKSIDDFTADLSAWMLLSRYQIGDNTSKITDYLGKMVMKWKRLTAAGSLLGDDGEPLPSRGGPKVGPYDKLGPTPFDGIYALGDRYGVPDDAVRTDFSDVTELSGDDL